MIGIKLNEEVIDRCVRALAALVDIQGSSRRRLVRETQAVCSKCERAYSALLHRLLPVKKASRSPLRLASELRLLSADRKARESFKPEGLCSEIDQLLADFQSNLSGVKFSVHLSSIGEIRETLRSMGSYDQALYHQYDRFMSELDQLSSAIETSSKEDRTGIVKAAQAAIRDLEEDLSGSLKAMRSAKDRIVRIM